MSGVNLIFVDENNHNKFYTMTDLGNGTFRAEWGRVGAEGQNKDYAITLWRSKLRDKLKKGYTEIAKPARAAAPSDLSIGDRQVRELVRFLMKAAKNAVEASYQVAAGEVTPGQIAGAQELLDRASRLLKGGRHTRDGLNAILKELYRAIPRRMADTRRHFLDDGYTVAFATELLQAEQGLLDTLESQTKGNAQKLTLDALGLDIAVADQADRDLIAAKTDFAVAGHRIFRVVNKKTEAAFRGGKRTRLLYHGTRNANWLSVLQKGLRIRPSGIQTTGSMFGEAIYFANRARKSLGYTSLKGSHWASGAETVGYLAVFEVDTGREWNLLKKERYAGWMGGIDAARVGREGFDTVFAKAGADLRNDEHVVYDPARCTIRYLIEVKK